MEWEIVIGLEVHIQLLTNSKIFSGAATDVGAEPNTQACIIDLGLPGVLPVLNRDTVKMAVKFGLAINADICRNSRFARKNYFYPDLPKGYQISQHHHPIVGHGTLDVSLKDGSTKTINIVRAHLEEDAGKSLHEDFHGLTGVDLNRAGVPLLEIVSAPDMRSAEEAIVYLKALHTLVCYLGICDGNMQDGSFRCDANISVRQKGAEQFGTRAEIKNLNSFRFIERAINFEAERQINLIAAGGTVIQETRLFDSVKNETRGMRAKEEANDYRYFPEPDLLPVELNDEFIDTIRVNMPELPRQKYLRFMRDYELSSYDADSLISTQAMSDYFEKTLELSDVEPKLVANWVMGELSAALNKTNTPIDQSPLNEEQLAGLLKRIADKTISGNIAKTVFEALWTAGGDADTIIENKGLKQVTDSSAIESIVDEVLAASPEQLAEYRSGKVKLFGFFVGKVMQASKGKANPEQVNKILKEKL